jgi:hypothetical protein
MRHLKQTAAVAFLVGGVALGLAPAAGAATAPADSTAAALTGSVGQVQVPVDYWQKECPAKKGSAWKYGYGKGWQPGCKWVKYHEDKPNDLKECFGGYGPMCGDVTAVVERTSIPTMVGRV